MEARRVQPRRAAQDAYAQARAAPREPLMLEPHARADKSKSPPGGVSPHPDTFALSSPSHHREQKLSSMGDQYIKSALRTVGYPAHYIGILGQVGITNIQTLLNKHPSFAVAGPVDQAGVKELLVLLHAADPGLTDAGVAADAWPVETARRKRPTAPSSPTS